MSINDLLNNGIEIQGRVEVVRWIDDKENIIFKSNEVIWNQNYDWMDADIKYMYAISGVGLKIEIE